jgi:hypothetical protein
MSEGQTTPDFGVCHACREFKFMNWVDGAGYCNDHVPVQMDNQAMDMIFAKAGVPGPKRYRPFESILGVLFLSKKHHKQAALELEQLGVGRMLE